jgi:hypothetical protein
MPSSRNLRRALLLGVALSVAFAGDPASAKEHPDATPLTRGRPKVTLDRLTFPGDVPDSAALAKHLRRILAREARRADWGAGRGSRIEYRFSVTELTLRSGAGVLRVRCTAHGTLPKGRGAKSHLDYGGDPQKRSELVKRVLEIVARGVITRLAELERVRRGELHRSGIRIPRSGELD